MDEVLVIAVVRRADYWLPSAWTESVRSGHKMALGRSFAESRAHLLDHFALIGRWTEAFGAAAFRCLPYLEGDERAPAAVSWRMLRAAGLIETENDRRAGWTMPGTLVRPGLSAFAVEVLRRLNRQLETQRELTGADRERMVAILAERFPGPGVRLTSAAARALAEHGWVESGLGSHPNAWGEDWTQWRAAPPAPVHPSPQPAEQDVNDTVDVLRAAGLTGRVGLRRIGLRWGRRLRSRSPSDRRVRSADRLPPVDAVWLRLP